MKETKIVRCSNANTCFVFMCVCRDCFSHILKSTAKSLNQTSGNGSLELSGH
jgi:hypothetical protein